MYVCIQFTYLETIKSISCEDMGAQFYNKTVKCPAYCKGENEYYQYDIWGNGTVFYRDSSICTAAIYGAKLTDEAGGIVTVSNEIKMQNKKYPAGNKHGIYIRPYTSLTLGMNICIIIKRI